MAYEVNVTDEFKAWILSLTEAQQEAIAARVDQLEVSSPHLGEPTVKRIRSSTIHNLKELRCSAEGTLRILFVFDPRSPAILLLGGDKTGQWKEWYRVYIPRAEVLYTEYLEELKDERLL